MESEPRGRRSKDLPPELSEYKKKLNKAATKFIQQLYVKEPRMREIVYELWRTSENVEQMQRNTDTVRTGAAVSFAGGLLVVLLAAALTGGGSLAAAGIAGAGGGALGAGGALGVGGAVGVGGANVVKMTSEIDSVEAVKTLGKEFQEIVEPLKKTVEEIKEMFAKLGEETAEYQSGNTLTNIEEFEEILGRVSKLKKESIEALLVTTLSTQTTENLLILLVKVFRPTASPAGDRQLRDAIMQSAVQSEKVVDECKQMPQLLEMIREVLELLENSSGGLVVASEAQNKSSGSLDVASEVQKKSSEGLDVASEVQKKSSGGLDGASEVQKKSSGGLDGASEVQKKSSGGLDGASEVQKESSGSLDVASEAQKKSSGDLDGASEGQKESSGDLHVALMLIIIAGVSCLWIQY